MLYLVGCLNISKLCFIRGKIMEEQKENKFVKWVKNSNKQKIFTYLAYILIILVSTFVSAFSVGFDITQMASWAFIGNLLFNYAVAMMGLLVAISDGENFFENRKVGDYAKAKEDYATAKTQITNKNYIALFPEYIDYRYKIEKRQAINKIILDLNLPSQIYDLSKAQIKMLITAPLLIRLDTMEEITKEEYFTLQKQNAKVMAFDLVSEEHANKVIELKEKGIYFPHMNYASFFTSNGECSWEQVAEQEQNKKKIKRLGMLYRAIMLVLVSAIIAVSTIGLNDAPVGKVVSDTFNRLFNLVCSIFFGYSLAKEEDLLNITILTYKADMLICAITDIETKRFIPENIEDKVLAKYDELQEERKKKEVEAELVKEQAIKNVVDNSEYVEMSEDDYKKYMSIKKIEKK